MYKNKKDVRLKPLTNLFVHVRVCCAYSMPSEYLLFMSALNAANDSWVMYFDAAWTTETTSSGRNAWRGLGFGTMGAFTSSGLGITAATGAGA